MADNVNLFLIGAQKSGSTALASFLDQHSDISVSRPKAPNYFNRKFKKDFQITSLKEYHNLFDFSKMYQCDASDCYHADPTALRMIYEYNPSAKVIMILRDPLKMMISLHSHLMWAGYEDEENLNKAFAMESSRRLGSELPRRCKDPAFIFYRDLCGIGDQIELLIDIFGREKLLFLVSQDLKNNPVECMNNIFDWLAVPPYSIDESSGFKNESVRPRFKIISEFNGMISPRFKTSIKMLLIRLGINADGLMRRVNGVKLKSKTEFLPSKDILKFCGEQKDKACSLTGLSGL